MRKTAVVEADQPTLRPQAARAASAYRDASVAVGPVAAIVLALDRVLLNLRRVTAAIEAGRHDEAFNFVSHSATILRGLGQALDPERGGALVERLRSVYRTHIVAMYVAIGKKDAIRRVNVLAAGLSELRDAWAFVAKQPAIGKTPAGR